MTTTKEDFIKTFLPETIVSISFAQIDLDIADLSISDVLRNVNKTFPPNTRNRNNMISGSYAVGILCKSELVEPLSGLLLIISNDENHVELVSKNYIVITVPENKIMNDEDIKNVIDGFTKYLITAFKESLIDFNTFYAKFIYDQDELVIDTLDDLT